MTERAMNNRWTVTHDPEFQPDTVQTFASSDDSVVHLTDAEAEWLRALIEWFDA